MSIAAIHPAAERAPATVESRASWVTAGAAMAILSFSYGAPLVAAVALKPIAAELGSARSLPALAAALAWLGSGLGGVAMGWLAERLGVRRIVMMGALMIALGLALSAAGGSALLVMGHAAVVGIAGLGAINVPLITYVSRWFDRRRGTALALISSGQYIAGVIWPVVFERAVAELGWRETMVLYGALALAAIVPLAVVFLKAPPAAPALAPLPAGTGRDAAERERRPAAAFPLLALAGFLCCVPMAMPQGHLVAFCSDVGIAPAHGAAMLSLLLGCAFLSRQFWGWTADRIGGLATILVGSAWQCAAIAAFLATEDEAGLFAVAAAFGLGFAGIIPAYVLTICERFPRQEIAWRVPLWFLCGLAGMAFGSWLAGALYDYFGFYAPAFAAGIVFNLANLLVIGWLMAGFRRQRHGLAMA